MLSGSRRAFSAPSDRLRVALIGAGGRGRDLLHTACATPGVELAAICDPDEERARSLIAEAESLNSRKPRQASDLRRIYEDREIDAVILTCCNHWHALGTVWAVQAGKHVYVEKPVSHDIAEGQRMVEAARKYNRIVQGGTQRRSSPRFRRAISMLHSGVIGEIYMARWLFTGPRDSLGFKDAETPPASLHWDLWLGPARQQPFHRNLVHYNWHWFWEFGNGEMGNNGVHSMDVVRWALNKGLPKRIHSSGGRFGYKDQGQTPNTQIATFEYDDGVQVLCEIRGLYSDEPTGMHFYGSKGSMHLEPWGASKIVLGRKKEAEPELTALEETQEASHFLNFTAAIRAGKPELLNCDIAEAEQSTAMCHLANISYRLGRELRFDPARRRFTGDEEADRMLAREYRKPFVMPERV
jgi:predicted dehydrogenase